MKYSIHFDFDCEGKPPKVYIWEENSGDILEVLEEPICKLGGKLVEAGVGTWAWEGPWSWDEKDWVPGPLAKKILEFLNSDFRQMAS